MLKKLLNILWLSLTIIQLVSGNLKLGDAIIQCNQYYRNTGNYASLPHHIRWASILNVAIHNAINNLHPHYMTFRNVSYDVNPSNSSKVSSVLGVCYTVKKFAIDHDLISNTNILFFPTSSPTYAPKVNDLTNFINDLKSQVNGNINKINNGYNYGITVANDLLNQQSTDGWNTIVPNFYGVFPYVPGQWYTAVFSDGVTYANGTSDFTNRGALNPNWAIMDTMGIISSSSINVNPRPALNTTEFYQSYLETFICGELSNIYHLRSNIDENDALAMVLAPSQVFINKMVEQVIEQNINDLNGYDIGYLYALTSLSLHDSAVHNTYWKHHYNFDRPIQLIYNGGGVQYPQYVADTNWKFFRNGAPNPEYPCAHCENTGAGLEALRLGLITIGLINSSDINHNDTIPGGTITICEGFGATSSNCLYPITVGKFVEFKDRVIRARVCGGMHYHKSGQVGKLVGEQVAAYDNLHHLLPLDSTEDDEDDEMMVR